MVSAFCEEGYDVAGLASSILGGGASGTQITALTTTLMSLCTSLSDEDAAISATNDSLYATTRGVNTGYLLMSAYLVFMMQCGFAMLCAGAVRSKNTKNILITNVMDAAAGAVAWWLIGYGIAFGVGGPIGKGLGTKCSNNADPSTCIYAFAQSLNPLSDMKKDPTSFERQFVGHSFFASHQVLSENYYAYLGGSDGYAHWLYQWTFSAAAAGIVSGSVAERSSFTAYLGFTALLTGIVYPFIVHWAWSPEGWLSAFATYWNAAEPKLRAQVSQGCIDFAGSGVVHTTGGWAGLMGAYFIGPRIGRFDSEGKVNDMPGHSATLYVLGTFLLWFGWYGFNPGSALLISGTYSEITARTALVTTIGAGSGGVAALFYYFLVRRNWNLLDVCNGVLCGLVTITSGCSTVQPWVAIIGGAVAVPVFHGMGTLILKLKIDDPLDAFPMHGGCGMWGCILTGLLADPVLVYQTYGIADYGGAMYNPKHPKLKWRGRLLGAQLILIVTIIAWTCGIMGGYFAILKSVGLARVTEQEEQMGLDVSKHGGSAYNTAEGTGAMVVRPHETDKKDELKA